MLHLSHSGLIAISSADAAKFLQGQVTCDVREVTEQQSRLGAWCNPQGRVQTTFRLFQYQGNYYLQLPRTMIATMINGLQKYAVFFKAKLEDVSDQWSQFGTSGTDIENDLTKFFDQVPSNIDQVVMKDNRICLRVPGIESRFVIIAKKDESPLLSKDINHWKLQDIQAGIPTIYPETAGEFTPQQINYPLINGVNFNKGCYTGQEIIARTHYLGKAKQQMYRVSFTAEKLLPPNTHLYLAHSSESRIVGNLIEIAAESTTTYQALAVLQNSAINEAVAVENPAGAILHILDLPYNRN